VKGGGAFRNGVKLSSPESTSHVIVPKLGALAVERSGLPTQISSSWPLLLRFALVAEGLIPAAISIGNKQDWDLAAGVLLVTESGGIVTTQKGQPFRFNQPEHHQLGLVASQQKWHKQLVSAVENL
jgi:myo-inositol-1(or 4)-monophosphatase